LKAFLIIFTCCLILYLIVFGINSTNQPIATVWKLPLNTIDRQDWSTVYLESDAYFKNLRAPFGTVKLHYHTGMDLQNRAAVSPGEPVYAIAAGKVIAIEDPPPQRRITIEHLLPNGDKVWSVYIHIIDEQVKVGDIVDSETVIARLMNAAELERYGKEYDHVHLEIMKIMPPHFINFDQRKTFTCYSNQQVDEYFYNPEEFLKNQFSK
jgi:murein DD-endopeptidase MepM/ murein hydrolase activator NlpD